MEDLFYLKPNVEIEPLIDRWYAWAHLLSPATSAMNVLVRHLKIINSYIQSPSIYEAAVKNAKMKGGSFMDYEGQRINLIQELKAKTLFDRA